MALTRGRISGWGGLLLGSVLGVAGFVLAVLLAARPEFKVILDLSPGHQASLTQVSRDIVAALRARDDVRIEIATFFERVVQAPNSNQQQRAEVAVCNEVLQLTAGLLRQYAALGGDQLVVRRIDRTDPKAGEDWTKRVKPVRGRNVVVVAAFHKRPGQADAVRVREMSLYYDLAAIKFGTDAPVPGKSPKMPRLMAYTGEEQISSAIKSLMAGGAPVACVLDGHQEMTGANGNDPYDYSELLAALKDDGFRIVPLNLGGDAAIPENATVLLSLEPKRRDFTKEECDKIHAFLQRGGRMFLTVPFQQPPSWNLRLSELLDRYGVKLGDEMVAQFYNNAPSEQAAGLDIRSMQGGRITEGLTKNQRSLALLDARPISRTAGEADAGSVNFAFLRTQKECWLQPGGVGADTPPPRQGYAAHTVGVQIHVRPKDGSTRMGQIILITGGGFSNRHLRRGAQREFVLNCFDALAERYELIAVHRAQFKPSTIELPADRDLAARKLGRVFLLLILGVPSLFLILGIAVAVRRSRA
ncbi:MAG: Gldg family protein [Planctomycetes bacterium]|nr:Gldg family protein [Planctomycetota bacterium]